AMFDIMEQEVRERGCTFINAYAELSEPEHPGLELAQSQKQWTREYFTNLAREAGAANPEIVGSQLFMLHEGAYVAYSMVDDADAAREARDAAAALLDVVLPEE